MISPAWSRVRRAGRQVWRRERVRRLLALLFVVVAVSVALAFRERLPETRNAGYAGSFVLALVGSASIFLPVPSLAATYAGGAYLNPALVALTAGVAEGLGEITGYLAGFGGQGVVERHRLYQQICRWMARRGDVAVFLLAAIPNPLFDLVGVAAGSLRFPVWRFVLAAMLGKTAKGAMVAYAGAISLPWIQQLYQSFFP